MKYGKYSMYIITLNNVIKKSKSEQARETERERRKREGTLNIYQVLFFKWKVGKNQMDIYTFPAKKLKKKPPVES